MKSTLRPFALAVLVLPLPESVSAQVTYALQHSFPAPPAVAVQQGRDFRGVAVDGGYTVAGAPDDGADVVKVFDTTSGALLFVLPNPRPATSDRAGYALAIAGTRVVVGNPRDDTAAEDAGSAYVYDLSSPTPTAPVVVLDNPGPAPFDFFGESVSISGTRVVVGTPFDDTGAHDAGRVYVYDLTSATPRVPIATLDNPNPADSDFFGLSVAIFGTRVVVGTRGNDTGARDAGNAYVYDLTSATPTVPVAAIDNPGPAEGDSFGSAVAIDGVTVAIGAPSDDTVFADKGSAYVFSSDADGDGLLDGWEIDRFSTTAGHGPLDDIDGDGRNGLLELAFGTDPLAPDAAAAPGVVDEGGFLTVTIAKQLRVTCEVQSAGTLLAGQPDSFSAATTMILLNNSTTLKVRDTVPIGTAPARFLRTKVAAAP